MRRFVAGFLMLSAAVLAACGNDDDSNAVVDPGGDNGGTPNGQVDDALDDGADDASNGSDAAPTRRALPTATPVPDDGVTILVTANGELTTFSPLEFQELPQTSISADGESYTGVSLVDLAAATGGGETTYVSIEGRSPDGQRFITVQFALGDVGADSVLVLGESGNATFASESIDPVQWVTSVAAVDFF